MVGGGAVWQLEVGRSASFKAEAWSLEGRCKMRLWPYGLDLGLSEGTGAPGTNSVLPLASFSVFAWVPLHSLRMHDTGLRSSSDCTRSDQTLTSLLT